MDILEREGIANAATVGEAMLARLRMARQALHRRRRSRPRPDDRHRDRKDQDTREAAPALRDRIVDLAFERGLLILGCGETSIRLWPPLIVNQHEADIALDILEECIEAAERERAKPGALAGAAR